MLARKDKIVTTLTKGIAGLFRKNKVTAYTGTGRITAPGKVTVEGADGETALTAKNILIATGSNVATLRGVTMDWDRIGGSTEALAYNPVPKRLVVIGAGVIGLELGSVWARLGSRGHRARIPRPRARRHRPRPRPRGGQTLQEAGPRYPHRRAGHRRARRGERCIVEYEGGEPIECDRVLVAVGRRPNTDGLGLDAVGIQVDERGRIPVDAHFATAVDGIYAIGDVIAGPMLAHKAEEEGVACVERIATGHGHVNYDAIPNVVYTHPEIASVGKTEDELEAAGVEYRKGSFPFLANARARALASTDGFVKILADAKTDRVLGVHIIGPRAGDLIAEAAVAMEFGASAEDIARSVPRPPDAVRSRQRSGPRCRRSCDPLVKAAMIR
jgi:dihydrolipoamide dehydrogenase